MQSRNSAAHHPQSQYLVVGLGGSADSVPPFRAGGETVPEGADAQLKRVVIHDWEDDEAIAILKVCRRAMRETAKLLLIERLVGPPNEMPATKFSDLNMLVSPGGRERTREEFSDLFAKSGFELTRAFPAGIHNVIEARPR